MKYDKEHEVVTGRVTEVILFLSPLHTEYTMIPLND